MIRDRVLFGPNCRGSSSSPALSPTADASPGAPPSDRRAAGDEQPFRGLDVLLTLSGWLLLIFGMTMLPFSLMLFVR